MALFFHYFRVDIALVDFFCFTNVISTSLEIFLCLKSHCSHWGGAFWEIIHTLVSFESLVSLVSFLSFVSFVSGVSLREFWGSRSVIFKGLV